MENKPNLTQEIEKLIEETSLQHVLTALEHVCVQKSVEILQGKKGGNPKPWAMLARRINIAANMYVEDTMRAEDDIVRKHEGTR